MQAYVDSVITKEETSLRECSTELVEFVFIKVTARQLLDCCGYRAAIDFRYPRVLEKLLDYYRQTQSTQILGWQQCNPHTPAIERRLFVAYTMLC